MQGIIIDTTLRIKIVDPATVANLLVNGFKIHLVLKILLVEQVILDRVKNFVASLIIELNVILALNGVVIENVAIQNGRSLLLGADVSIGQSLGICWVCLKFGRK